MKSLLILLSGVLLIGLEECRLYEEVFVPIDVSISQARIRRQAPTVNVHKIPKTSFTCQGKKSGEYYADTETKCQVYHVCVPGFHGKMSSMSFVCPNGTIFSQANRVCTPFDRVDCALTKRFYETLHGDPNQHRTDYDGPTGPSVPVHRPVHHHAAPPPPPPPSRPRQSSQAPARPHSAPPPPPPPSHPRQSSRAPPPSRSRQARPTSPPSTAAPVRTTRPNVPRGPQVNVPRTSFRSSSVSTSTSSYEYDYEYDYEEEPENKRTKREVDPLKFFLYDSSRIPIETNFSCDDKVSGSIYADVYTNCEMFHLCIPINKKKLLDYKLFCNEGKAFNQERGYCQDVGTFDCSKSEKFYKYDKISSYFTGKKIIHKTVNKLKAMPTE